METNRYDEPTGPSGDPQVDALNQAYAKLSAAELSDADREALNDGYRKSMAKLTGQPSDVPVHRDQGVA